MADLTNSHSLTEIQRNAKAFIEAMNQSKEPVLITENGKVQAVLVDPVSYQAMEERMERDRLLAAIAEGEADIRGGRTKPATEFFAELKTKHGF